jgi:acyl CoA:acetate/3-ketoacid CoA transferase alpha subunit
MEKCILWNTLFKLILLKAWKGDEAGNLVFKGTARNFNPCMAGAAKNHHCRS